jgi:hypothetical protein
MAGGVVLSQSRQRRAAKRDKIFAIGCWDKPFGHGWNYWGDDFL